MKAAADFAIQGMYKVKSPQGKNSDWQVEKILDQASSNATLIDLAGKQMIIATNRETDEVAMYTLED